VERIFAEGPVDLIISAAGVLTRQADIERDIRLAAEMIETKFTGQVTARACSTASTAPPSTVQVQVQQQAQASAGPSATRSCAPPAVAGTSGDSPLGGELFSVSWRHPQPHRPRITATSP
jgi:hypothetical protein